MATEPVAVSADPPAADGRAAWRLPWNELLDGRLHWFARGVHYSGPAEAVEQEARDAATELGKTAITFRDDMEVFEYVWVQFVDGRVEEGQPCPHCGYTSFDKVQEFFLRCQSCRYFYAIAQPKPVIPEPERPPIAEFLDLKLLSAEGDEIKEVSALEELVLEATCSFFRPIWAFHAGFIFYAGGKKMLHAASPDVVTVPEPETVRFRLHVAPRVLTPGEYSVSALAKLVLDEDADEVEKVAARTLSRGLRVFDPHAEVPPEHRGERATLHWSSAEAASGAALPVIDEWVADDDEDGDG
ncbi:MAG: hypothetical protein ACJ76S_03440 [Solirubrobacteraceae bacterium]|jgi:hypothetical protein